MTSTRSLRSVSSLVMLLLLLASSIVPGVAIADEEQVTVVTDGDELELEAASDQRIHGETTAEAGTELVVRMRSASGADDAFLKSKTTTVDKDGTFSATFDLSEISPETRFVVSVSGPNIESTDSVDGIVVPCQSQCVSSESTETESPPKYRVQLPVEKNSVSPTSQVVQGESGQFHISFGDSEVMTFTLGGPEAGYEIAANVRDVDGNGQVVVVVHTDNAGHDAPTLVAKDEDELSVVGSETELDGQLDVGTYDLKLYQGDEASGDTVDTGTFSVVESSSEIAQPREINRTAYSNETESEDNSSTVTRIDAPNGGLDFSSLATALGALVVGSILAVAAIGLILGLFRT